MRKIITFVSVLSFVITASLNLALAAKGSEDEFIISGRVAAIEDGTVSLEESNGEIFNIAARSGDQLEGIEIGDTVFIKYEDGRAAYIEKIAGTETTRQYAKQSPVVPTEIEGEITNVKGNTLTLTDETGRTYRVKAADPRVLGEVRVGDIVRVEAQMRAESQPQKTQKKIKLKATSIQRIEENGYGGYVPESPYVR